ncbi:DMT family transporter [Acuticoccus sp.]|uniref:DMT family transporter n=1 Tax=Acuticoccus sp. TaxID=1904378 RepID=UPI003B523DA8
MPPTHSVAVPTARPASLSMAPLDWGLLLTLSVLWGGSFFFTGVAVRELPTLTIVALRVGLAAIVLWAVLAALGRPVPRTRSVWLAFLVMGVLNNVVPFVLFVYGQQTIASALAAILNATTPLFTVVVAGVLLTDERLTAGKLVGVAVGFAGVVLMVGPRALEGLGADGWAQLACLAAALSYACAGVWGRRFRTLKVDPIVVAAGQVTVSAALLVPIALFLDAPWTLPAPSMATGAAIVALAVVSTALAYILYFKILERAGATNVLLVTLLVPASAIVLGTLILGERLGWVHAAGMALIAVGLSAIDGRLWRALDGARRGKSGLG